MPDELISYPLFEDFRPVPKIVLLGDENRRPRGRPRKYASNAEKKRAYRRRQRQSRHHRTRYTGEQEWYTPAEYIDAVRQVLGTIDLDPASSDAAQAVVQATRYYTKADNGLMHAWQGRVWLNPPYAQPLIVSFVTRLVEEYQAGHVPEAILLTHNSTETTWFQRADAVASSLCLPRKRIAFRDPQGNRASPTQAQVFCYFGTHPERFTEVFAPIGRIR